jgi:O-antigen/teichoic acid export membrane protein
LSVVVSRIAAWIYGRSIGIDSVPWIWPTRALQPLLHRFIGRLGIAYFFYGVLFILLQTDVLVVGWLADPVVAGQYVLVWKIAEVIVLMLWRIPEHLQSEFIAMDAQGELDRLARVYSHGVWTVRALAFVASIGYAFMGPWLVRLWVGPEHAPTNRWAFALAGAAIFWLASARMPAVLAYASMRLKPLLRVAAIEVIGKLVLMFVLFPITGYLAPLVAINGVHLGGIAVAYAKLGRFATAHRMDGNFRKA